MKKQLNWLRDNLMQGKVYVSRVQSYVGLLNFGMIIFLFLDKASEKGVVGVDLSKYFVLILIGWIILLGILGWIEIKFFKGFQKEATINFLLSPPYVEMKKQVGEILSLMKDKEKIQGGKNNG